MRDCVEDNTLFHFHENPNPACPVGRNIHNILDDKLVRVQNAMERELASITMADMKQDLERCLKQEEN
ncbi:Rrf2 family transcriptional regulator [Bariatricus sp. SGI.154]|uniref:Rrf2 family transcriptional regulator n=1 Tax=Bariatricus sp. SGI.154 TaxID=3420549 RepID=UPI003D07EEF7